MRILKRIVIIPLILIFTCIVIDNSVSAQQAPSHLQYFGYFAVKCLIGESSENHIPNLASLNNSNIMFLFNVKKDCLESAKQANIKVLAWAEPYVFDISSPSYPRRGYTKLKTNWEEGWNRFKEDIRGYEDIIYAFYFEEPWWYGINEGDLSTITNRMKQDFPNTGRFAIEAGVSLRADPLAIDKVYKRYYQNLTDLAVDYYGSDFDDFSDWNPTLYGSYFNEIYLQLTSPEQKVWVVPQTFSTSNNPNFSRLTEIFNSYYDIAVQYPRVVGMLNFLYSPSPCCGHSVKEFTDPTSSVYNQAYKNRHVEIGQAILRNSVSPTNTVSPSITGRITSGQCIESNSHINFYVQMDETYDLAIFNNSGGLKLTAVNQSQHCQKIINNIQLGPPQGADFPTQSTIDLPSGDYTFYLRGPRNIQQKFEGIRLTAGETLDCRSQEISGKCGDLGILTKRTEKKLYSGDANGDNLINTIDFELYRQKVGENGTNIKVDFDYNGKVEYKNGAGDDFEIFKNNFGKNGVNLD